MHIGIYNIQLLFIVKKIVQNRANWFSLAMHEKTNLIDELYYY